MDERRLNRLRPIPTSVSVSPDHKTLVLRDWHAVYMNNEHQSQSMRFVAFID